MLGALRWLSNFWRRFRAFDNGCPRENSGSPHIAAMIEKCTSGQVTRKVFQQDLSEELR
jgi:hypothetical protein